jgi:hypothetical protein
MMRTTSMFMQGAEVRIKPAGEEQADYDNADFINDNIHTMYKDFSDIMSDIVNFVAYGWFDCELVYEHGDDGRIRWKKWAPRHPTTLDRWDIGPHGDLRGMWQQWLNQKAYIPIEKLIHFTTTGAGKNNPEGTSVFEGGYTSWFYSKNLSILEAVVCERLSGTPTMKMPPNVDLTESGDNSDIGRAKRIVRNIKTGDDMGLTLPDGWNFEYTMPSHGPAIDISEVILRHDRAFARTLLMDFIMLGAKETGSFAMIKDKSSMYVIALNTYLSKIAGAINNQAIPRLFELNAMPRGSGLPTLYFDKISKVDIGDYSTMISNLFNAGAVTYSLDTENQIRRVVGLEQIREPGMMLKPNLPAQANPEDGKEVGETKIPKSQAAYTDAETAEEMEEMADRVGMQLVRAYDKAAKGLRDDIKTDNEEEWEGIVDFYLSDISEALKDRLSRSFFSMWKEAVGDRPGVEGLRAIVMYLSEQADYIDDSLLPGIRSKILESARNARDEGVTPAFFSMAISAAIDEFRYRVSQYAGSVYSLFANHAGAQAAKKKADSIWSTHGLSVNWDTGKLVGDGLLARYSGPEDERNCRGCDHNLDLGWTNPENLTPIGQNECLHNCRHFIEYKYRGRIL